MILLELHHKTKIKLSLLPLTFSVQISLKIRFNNLKDNHNLSNLQLKSNNHLVDFLILILWSKNRWSLKHKNSNNSKIIKLVQIYYNQSQLIHLTIFGVVPSMHNQNQLWWCKVRDYKEVLASILNKCNKISIVINLPKWMVWVDFSQWWGCK